MDHIMVGEDSPSFRCFQSSKLPQHACRKVSVILTHWMNFFDMLKRGLSVNLIHVTKVLASWIESYTPWLTSACKNISNFFVFFLNSWCLANIQILLSCVFFVPLTWSVDLQCIADCVLAFSPTYLPIKGHPSQGRDWQKKPNIFLPSMSLLTSISHSFSFFPGYFAILPKWFDMTI